MIVYLSDYLSQYIPSLRVVSYLTFRAVMSLFTALAISLFFGPYVIRNYKCCTSDRLSEMTVLRLI